MAEVMSAIKMEPSMQLTPPQSSPQPAPQPSQQPQQQPQQQQYHNTQQPAEQHDSPQMPLEQDTKSAQPTPNRPPMSLSASASRRPPRKSTLTQQQKNQKRQRATQDQLLILELEFNKNPTPTALVRDRIAQDINMTERSVQIWFQNRRAKIKNIAKRSIETGEDCDSIPDSMRQYLAMQAYGPGGKGLAASLLGRNGAGFPTYGGALCLSADAANGKTQIQHFACRSLSIGSWRRVGQSSLDLIIFYSPDKACVTYYINNDQAGYKIEYPFAWIKNIWLEHGDLAAAAEGASQHAGGLFIELNHPPKFYMDSSGSGGFYECGDFTEDQQASQVMIHHLGGPSKVLSGQLAKLVSLEAYQNRANTFDMNPFGMVNQANPVTPMRPASQPNHLLHPHHQPGMPMFQPDQAMTGLMGPPAPRGHKRQRSRSVPAAIDVSMLRGPMPSFLIQHDGQPPQPPMQDPNIFAPIPQHHPHPGFAPPPGSLSIDTNSNFAMGMPFAAPVSATSANSPSEYGTPAFFASGPQVEAQTTTHFGTPYNHGGFLVVDPAAMIGTSNTPLSVASHGDPVIADHSPPLHGLGRSQSADIFGTPGEHSQFGDEGLYLSESFNKQMRLPFRSPMPDEAFHSPIGDAAFAFQSPTPANGNEGQISLSMDGPPRSLSFDCTPTQDGSLMYHSPGTMPAAPQQQQHHQDSAVAFSTPSHVPKDQAAMFQDSKMYSSPGQMASLPDDQAMYHHSPLSHGMIAGDDVDVGNMSMYVDPHKLRTHQ